MRRDLIVRSPIISIHALTRSATSQRCSCCGYIAISIHALTRSATPLIDAVGCCCGISIHALTRSATWHRCKQRQGTRNFNPRTHKECDLFALPLKPYVLLFQSTHSQGVRHFLLKKPCSTSLFQSTHSQGVRPIPVINGAIGWRFQSTHSQGVRQPTRPIVCPGLTISIHALTRSATLFCLVA